MYGMIHRAIRSMALERLGKAAVDQVIQQAGHGPNAFISGSTYDDAVTLSLIGSCAAALEIDVPTFLEHFGEYWIEFASSGAYASLMTIGGSDLPTFLNNLDRLHQSVQAAMPQARLPSFTVQELGETFIRVSYVSERRGLENFVVGLLRGLLKRFNQQGEVVLTAENPAGADFEIRYSS
jgi:hypothetical protein